MATASQTCGSPSVGGDDNRVLRIALWQCSPDVVSNKTHRIAMINSLCARAQEVKAHFLVLPEMFLTGYAIGTDMVRLQAEDARGASAEQISSIAEEYSVSIIYGYPELGEGGNIYNSVNIISDKGEVTFTYRKQVLFGEVDRAQFSSGELKNDVVDINGVKFGVAICYDIEFPEVARKLAVAGAEVILVPTANMHPYESVADRLVPARAQENGVFVVYANYSGSDKLFKYFGKSMVCDPLGETVATVNDGDHLLVADLNMETLKSARRLNNYVRDYQMSVLG